MSTFLAKPDISDMLLFLLIALIIFFCYRNKTIIKDFMFNYEKLYVSNNEFFITKIEEIKTTIEHLERTLEVTENNRIKRHRLKNEIEVAFENILANHDQVDKRFRTICVEGKNKTIEFGEMLLSSLNSISIDFLVLEASNYFDILKNRCNENFPLLRKTIDYLETPESVMLLSRYMRDKTEIKGYIKILMSRIKDAQDGAYNGKTDDYIINMLREFMEKTIRAGIQAFQTFQHFNTYTIKND